MSDITMSFMGAFLSMGGFLTVTFMGGFYSTLAADQGFLGAFLLWRYITDLDPSDD